MHKTLGFFALSATITLGISNPDASIFALDSCANSQGSEIPFLSNDTAQRLLNYRMRSSTITALRTVDRGIVELLDRYGGMQPSLFGISSDDQDSRSSLIILQGLDPVIGRFFGYTDIVKLPLIFLISLESSIQNEYKQGLVHCDSRAAFLHDIPLNWNIDGASEDDAGTADGHCLKYFDSDERKPENVQVVENGYRLLARAVLTELTCD